MRLSHLVFAALAFALAGVAVGDEPLATPDNRTVLGPRNPELNDGAQALLAGDVEEGIRLTRIGLEAAVGRRERQAGLSNLCASYVLLGQYDTALEYCNQAIGENPNNWRALCNRALTYIYTGRFDEARADLDRGEAIAPYATSLKEARGILLDATDPVIPNIVIDDRRDGNDEG